jgi:DNA-binding response OmpR family regulator
MSDARAVLYVEDDPLVRELAATALEEAGFEVVTRESGTSALEALDDDADPFCAVVTDINLGAGPDGWDIARRARELNHAIPVVYVSGASGHEWKSKGVLKSVMIAKPFKITQLVAAISSLLKKTGLVRQV